MKILPSQLISQCEGPVQRPSQLGANGLMNLNNFTEHQHQINTLTVMGHDTSRPLSSRG